MTKQRKMLLSLSLVFIMGGCSVSPQTSDISLYEQTRLSTGNSDLGSLNKQENKDTENSLNQFEEISNYVKQNEAKLKSEEIIYDFDGTPLANGKIIQKPSNTKKEKLILADNLTEYTDVKTDSNKYEIKLSADKNKLYINYLDTDKKGIVTIKKEDKSIVYKVEDAEFIALTQGDGTYDVKLYKTKSGMVCTALGEVEIDISNTDKKTVYSKQSYYSNYDIEDEHFTSLSDDLWEKSNSITDYIWNCYIKTADYPYDYNKSTSLTDGLLMRYRPDVKELVEEEKGICLDKAAVMASLLRAKGIPTKIVFGHYIDMYHAWVEVFYNNKWLMFDPTLKNDYTGKNIENYKISRYN